MDSDYKSFYKEVQKLLATARKTEVAKAKERTQLKKKMLDRLNASKKDYAAKFKILVSLIDDRIDKLEHFFGIVMDELPAENRSDLAMVNRAITEYKKYPSKADYEDLDKCIKSVNNWNTTSPDNAPLKLAAAHSTNSMTKYIVADSIMIAANTAGNKIVDDVKKAVEKGFFRQKHP
jgi:hypothetical protein